MSPNGPRASFLFVMGWILIGFGLVLVLCGFSLDTTVYSDSLERVHNFGKLTDKVCLVLLGVGIAIVGAIFIATPSGRE